MPTSDIRFEVDIIWLPLNNLSCLANFPNFHNLSSLSNLLQFKQVAAANRLA